jgi:hypothetical protein
MLLSAILAAAVLIDGPVPESGNFKGEAAIEAFGSRGVAVYVDTNRDASYDHLFLLQAEEHGGPVEAGMKLEPEFDGLDKLPTRGEQSYFADATIEFAPGYVRIVEGARAIELFVEGTQTASWNPNGARVWRRAGYGLAHEIHESGISVRSGHTGGISSEFCDASSNCDPGDTDGGSGGSGGGGGTLCDSGGPGSTGCSVSSGGSACTSTCGTGYYACCMNGLNGVPAKCRCIRG